MTTLTRRKSHLKMGQLKQRWFPSPKTAVRDLSTTVYPQEVKAAADAQALTSTNTKTTPSTVDVLSIGYTEMIAPLIVLEELSLKMA